MRLNLRINDKKTGVKSAANGITVSNISSMCREACGHRQFVELMFKQMESLSATFLPYVSKLVERVCRTEVKRDGIDVSNISSMRRDASRHSLLN